MKQHTTAMKKKAASKKGDKTTSGKGESSRKQSKKNDAPKKPTKTKKRHKRKFLYDGNESKCRKCGGGSKCEDGKGKILILVAYTYYHTIL